MTFDKIFRIGVIIYYLKLRSPKSSKYSISKMSYQLLVIVFYNRRHKLIDHYASESFTTALLFACQ